MDIRLVNIVREMLACVVVKSMHRNSPTYAAMRTPTHGPAKRIKFAVSTKNNNNNKGFEHKKPRIFYLVANMNAAHGREKKNKYIIHKRCDAIPLDVQIKLCLCIIIPFRLFFNFSPFSLHWHRCVFIKLFTCQFESYSSKKKRRKI